MSLSSNAEKLQAWFNMYNITPEQYELNLLNHPKALPHGAFKAAFQELLDGGHLYGLTNTSVTDLNPSTIYSFNTITGAATELVHLTPEVDSSGFASNHDDGCLYRFTTTETIVFQKINITTLEVTLISTSGDTFEGNPETMTWDGTKFLVVTDAQEFLSITPEGVITLLGTSAVIYSGFGFASTGFGDPGNVLFGVIREVPLFTTVLAATGEIDFILGEGAIINTIEGLSGSLKITGVYTLTTRDDSDYAYFTAQVVDEFESTGIYLLKMIVETGACEIISSQPTNIQQLAI